MHFLWKERIVFVKWSPGKEGNTAESILIQKERTKWVIRFEKVLGFLRSQQHKFSYFMLNLVYRQLDVREFRAPWIPNSEHWAVVSSNACCLSICPSSIHASIYLSVCLSICLSILHVSLYPNLPTYLSIYLSIYLHVPTYLHSTYLLILSYPKLPTLYLPTVPTYLPACLSYPFLFYILSFRILSYPILSYPILSYPILSYSILSYPILPYPILPYPVLS